MGKAPDLDYISASLRPLAQPLHNLHPDQRNARRHDERNIDAIADSLRQFGQQKPIVVQKNGKGFNVLAGNGTLRAALKLGWTHLAAAEFDRDDTGAAVAFGIADNRTAELAEWDGEMVAGLLEDLAGEYSPADLGFTDDELDGLLADEPGEVVEDEVPEPPTDPITKPGDLWTLGDHRVLCGDSTSEADVALLTEGALADCLLTDPPYGVSYTGGTSDKLTIVNDDLSEDGLAGLCTAAFGLAEKHTREGAYWYATVPPGPLHLVFLSDWKQRGVLRQVLVWKKDSLVLGHSEYHYQHEPILFGWKPGGSRHKNKDRTRTTVWEVDRPKASREHPTMKPVALWTRAMADGSRTGERVYDPFLGSGTTLIAAEQLGRVGYGLEIDPAYCDVIVERWQNLTGGKATRG